MNRFNFFQKLFLTLIIALCFVTCKKDDAPDIDRQAPVIKSVSIKALNGSDTITPRDTLQFECDVEDNDAVSSVKVEIHFAENDHSHRMLSKDLEFVEIFNLDGKMERFGYQIFVPENTTIGKYHMIIQAIDMSGNESALSVTEFEISGK